MTTVSRHTAIHREGSDVAISSDVVFVGTDATPFIHMYEWTENGFGAKYANPATLPTGAVRSMSVTPDKRFLVCAVGNDTNRPQLCYRITSDGLVLVNSFIAANNITRTAAVNKSGTAVAVSNVDGLLTTYRLSRITGLGAQFGGTKNAVSRQCDFDSNDSRLMFVRETSPYMQIHPYDETSGCGTAFANSASGVGTTPGRAARFTADDSYLVLLRFAGSGTTLESYNIITDAGPGTKVASGVAIVNGTGVVISDAAGLVGVSTVGSPYVAVYPYSSGTYGTKLANPANLPTEQGSACAFNPAGTLFFAVSDDSNVIHAWPISGSAFGVRYAFPTSLPAGNGASVTFLSMS